MTLVSGLLSPIVDVTNGLRSESLECALKRVRKELGAAIAVLPWR